MSKIEELLHTFECHVMRMQTISDIPVADLSYEIGLSRHAVLLYVLHTEAQLNLVVSMCEHIKETLMDDTCVLSDVIERLDTAISIGGIRNV